MTRTDIPVHAGVFCPIDKPPNKLRGIQDTCKEGAGVAVREPGRQRRRDTEELRGRGGSAAPIGFRV